MTFLEELMKEINETKVSQTGPEDLPVIPGEKGLGKASVEVQKIESLLVITTDAYNAELENQDHEVSNRLLDLLEQKIELLNNMMWMAINAQFDSWEINTIGIRNDWLIVDATEQSQKLAFSSQKVAVRRLVDGSLDYYDSSLAVFNDDPNERIH